MAQVLPHRVSQARRSGHKVWPFTIVSQLDFVPTHRRRVDVHICGDEADNGKSAFRALQGAAMDLHTDTNSDLLPNQKVTFIAAATYGLHVKDVGAFL